MSTFGTLESPENKMFQSSTMGNSNRDRYDQIAFWHYAFTYFCIHTSIFFIETMI